MSHHSSTSSSKTLVSFPKPTKAFWLALLLVVIARTLIAFSGDKLNLFRSNTRDGSFVYIENYEIGQMKKPPRVVLMGSSRMRYGLMEDVFAEESGIPLEEIINTGTSNGMPIDVMWLLKRNPIVLEKAEILIIDFNRQMYNQQPIRPIFYRYASLSDRIYFDKLKDKAEGLTDWTFRNYTEKRRINDWLNGFSGKTTLDDILEDYKDRGMWTKLKGRVVPEHLTPEGAAKGYMGDFKESGTTIRAMNWIVETCKEHDIQLILLQTPTNSAYKKALETVPGANVGNEKYFSWLESFSPPAVFLNHDEPESLGLTDDSLVDYGHLDEKSAKVMTRFVVKELKQKGILPKE